MGNLRAQRISAEYSTIVAGYDFCGNSFINNGGADRETIPECFRCSQDVGVYFLRQYAVGPELPCTGEAVLDLIIDKNGANFIVPIPQS